MEVCFTLYSLFEWGIRHDNVGEDKGDQDEADVAFLDTCWLFPAQVSCLKTDAFQLGLHEAFILVCVSP